MDLLSELWKWAQENPLIMLAVAGAALFIPWAKVDWLSWLKKPAELLRRNAVVPVAAWQEADTVTAYLYLCRRFEGDEKATAILRELFGCFAPEAEVKPVEKKK